MDVYKLSEDIYNSVVKQAEGYGITSKKDIDDIYDGVESQLRATNPSFDEAIKSTREYEEKVLDEMLDRYRDIDEIKKRLEIDGNEELYTLSSRKKIHQFKKDEDFDSFKNRIASIETGSLKNPYTRTNQSGSNSSAFGKYQVTSNLASEMINKNSDIFEESELSALQEMVNRQEIALKVGGSDRKSYEIGGSNYTVGMSLAKKYGYKDVNKFLNDFDYGGSLGYPKDKIASLDKAQEKILKSIYDKHNNQENAAAEWHGGSNWEKSGHSSKTKNYINKFNKSEG